MLPTIAWLNRQVCFDHTLGQRRCLQFNWRYFVEFDNRKILQNWIDCYNICLLQHRMLDEPLHRSWRSSVVDENVRLFLFQWIWSDSCGSVRRWNIATADLSAFAIADWSSFHRHRDRSLLKQTSRLRISLRSMSIITDEHIFSERWMRNIHEDAKKTFELRFLTKSTTKIDVKNLTIVRNHDIVVWK